MHSLHDVRRLEWFPEERAHRALRRALREIRYGGDA